MELATVTRGNSAGPSKLDVAQAGKEVNKVKQITIIEIETHVRIGFSIWKCRAFPLTGVLAHHAHREKHQLEQD
jgi:hypothetical protein